MIDRLCVVGLGLLGGSVARAARERGLAREIVAVGRRASSLEPALRAGVVDRATTDLAGGAAEADFCLLATPVTALERQLAAVWAALPARALVTDVGSTKGRIVETAERLAARRPLAFVGSHPMAGSERAGFAEARADLFEAATVILTPTERTPAEAVARVRGFWEALGGRVTVLDPATHDRAVAAVSHLPHLVADALVDAVERIDPAAFDVAARGFRDTTRIAAADPDMWEAIFLANREAMAGGIREFLRAMAELSRLVDSGDRAALRAALARIKARREGLS